jgi:hypothetical protein
VTAGEGRGYWWHSSFGFRLPDAAQSAQYALHFLEGFALLIAPGGLCAEARARLNGPFLLDVVKPHEIPDPLKPVAFFW